MSFFRENYNNTASNIEKVSEIQLSIWNPDELLRGSVAEVFTQDTYENNVPKPNGLFDLRMGTIEHGQKCETCKMDNRNCTGHFGHIKLAKPVYYIQFLPMVLKVLKCVCWRCSKCLMSMPEKDDEQEELLRKSKGKGRFLAVYNWCQKNAKNCPSCSILQPNRYVLPRREKDAVVKVYAEFKDKENKIERKYLPVDRVLAILKRVVNDDVELIGLSPKYSRPDWMICTVLPIPPPHVRPSVRQDGNQKAEDDLTHKLSDIVKTNNSLKDKMSEDKPASDQVDAAKQIDEWHQLLQYHVATLVDNEIPGLPPASQRGSGRPLKSLKQRLSAKEGRMRNNLMGKRCDYTARTVITPDPNIALDELGVPLDIATNLTIPVLVTPDNLEEITALVKNGPEKFPGAKSVIRAADNTNIHLGYVNLATIKLEIGDIVNRHLLDGDVVLFNRQPSLHKMSMMGHRVRVLPKGLTFRLNVSVTTPYNADFDGDEMNTHLSQSYQTQSELKYLVLVPTQIVSPQKNAPVIGLTQDSLLGSNLFTSNSTKLSKKEMCRLMMWNDSFDGTLPNADADKKWSGRDIYSTILPKINIEKKTKKYIDGSHPDEVIRIENGKLISGVLDKTNVGNVESGLVHIVWKDYSPEACKDLIYNSQKLANNFLVMNGFSVGISDCLVSPETEAKIKENIAEAHKKVNIMIQKGIDGTYNTRSDRGQVEDFENETKFILNTARDNAGKISGDALLSTDNRLVKMISAGSKGDPTNIAQITGCLGQQEVEGKRAPLNMDKRVLPYYCKDDDSTEARGFISRSFKVGLTPQDYFFHAMAGRIGIIDTAIKTAETGYIQRRLIKSMEDISVKHDHTVRDSANNFIQFQYGEDGFDAAHLESVPLDFHFINDKEFFEKYANMNTTNDKYWKVYLTEEAYTDFLIDIQDSGLPSQSLAIQTKGLNLQGSPNPLEIEIGMLEERRQEFRKNILYIEDKVYSPIQIQRIIKNVIKKYNIDKIGFTDLNPCFCFKRVRETIDKMSKFLTLRNNLIYKNRAQNTLYILETILMVYLNSKQVVTKLKLNKLALEVVLKEVYKYFLRAIVNPGEMVGIIASQSIGEPATQMCVDGSETITVLDKNKEECYHGPIGPWIDNLLEAKRDTNKILGNRFIVNDMDNEEYYIHGVDMKTEKMNAPNRIRQISRLPANGKMMKITTRTGRTVTATMSHAFLRRLTKGIEKVSGDKLSVGDRIPIAYRLPFFDSIKNTIQISDDIRVELDEVFGSFLGCYLSNGIIDGDKISISRIPKKLAEDIYIRFGGNIVYINEGLSKDNDTDVADYEMINSNMVNFLRKECNSIVKDRKVPGFVFISSKEFISSVLRCYLDGDGNVAKEKHTIRCCSTSKQLIDDISLLLNYYHIVPYKFYQTHKSLYHLGIFTKYADSYLKNIGSNYRYKLNDLQAMVDYNNRDDCKSQMEFMDKIPKIGEIITSVARRLGLDKISRTYLRWDNVESIGRRTLKKYITKFEMYKENLGIDVEEELEILRQAYNCDVVWDKITEIKIIEEDKTKLVYDLSIENSETFMLGSGILVHNTLNTFHYSGVSAKSQTTTGVPRLKELLTISKNLKTPSLNVFLKEPFADNMKLAKKVSNNITLCSVQDILSEIQLFYEIRDEDGNIQLYHEEDREILEAYEHYQTPEQKQVCADKSRWVIRIILNKSKMNQRNINMFDIYQKISSDLETVSDMSECVYSDDNADNLLFRIQIYTEKNEPDLTDNERVNNNLYLKVKKFYKNVGKIAIKGLSNITGSYLDQTKVYALNPEDGSFKKTKNQWNISTDGSNLADIINILEIDGLKTVSNNINEIYELFGIEAARQALIEEFTATLSATSYVNYRHICILADVMTKNGILLPIDIHGVKKSDIGPLARASFEETVDQLVKSSCFAEVDKMSGVSANIMLGQVPPCGTGTVQVLFDERKMYIQTTEVQPEGVREEQEQILEDYSKLEKEVKKLKEVEGKCMNPKNYEFGFIPAVSSSIRRNILTDILSRE